MSDSNSSWNGFLRSMEAVATHTEGGERALCHSPLRLLPEGTQ